MATKVILQHLIKNPDRLNSLVNEAKELALQLGIIQRTHENPNSSEVVTYAPFTLFPTPVPKAALLQALAVQTHFNTLVNKISQDPDFLEEALAGTIQADDFTAKLIGIYREVQQEGRTQSIVVGLIRSDYMVDQRADGSSSLKQIEINTIAAGGFGVSDRLPAVHRHVMKSVGLLEESKCIQDTNRTPGMSAALAKAWELYGQQKAVILFLVEDVQISKLSHRYIERELWKRNIPVIRRRFEEVSRKGFLDGDKRLFIDGLEVAVVYYRYGYMPDNYTERTWDTRLLMERSLAVKCPDIATHLAGTKKVQQVLARPGVLEKFFPDQPQVVEQIRATFAGLYTLDMGPEGDRTVAMALASPDEFVLKPQREGGGNNFFGEDIVRVLQEVKRDKRRAAYILMDRIRPRTEQNILLRKGLPLKLASVCYEIGVCGAYLRHGQEMVLNEAVGHILRTKSVEHNDAGIIGEVTVFDNPLNI
ncbi:glutathione synthetase-like [Xiphias gladius]|uniref:glutathione synthetase-like n=1 Tax=Xiphias gladius TaxID=8245 RepID=UPI001A981F5F|nr:glutathione synthetase-like [Xiphias gladius]XP_040009736.1 glutathione synthetase-like [Xiphias gladius]